MHRVFPSSEWSIQMRVKTTHPSFLVSHSFLLGEWQKRCRIILKVRCQLSAPIETDRSGPKLLANRRPRATWSRGRTLFFSEAVPAKPEGACLTQHIVREEDGPRLSAPGRCRKTPRPGAAGDAPHRAAAPAVIATGVYQTATDISPRRLLSFSSRFHGAESIPKGANPAQVTTVGAFAAKEGSAHTRSLSPDRRTLCSEEISPGSFWSLRERVRKETRYFFVRLRAKASSRTSSQFCLQSCPWLCSTWTQVVAKGGIGSGHVRR